MENMIDNTGETLHEAGGVPELPEAEDFIYQHEETGVIGFIDAQQVEWGFFTNNPRLQKVSGIYTASQLRAYGEQCALAALAARPLSGGWEPIATAPKDGTPVLLRGRFKGVEVCAWNKHDSAYPWVFLDSDLGSGTNSRMDGYATHWAPIRMPAPPAGTDEGGRCA